MNMSTYRIKGQSGVIIESDRYLELPKAPYRDAGDVIRPGMIRYNKEWKSFEGSLDFGNDIFEYRRFANLDSNGRLLTSQLPESVISGLKYVGTFNPIIDDIDPPAIETKIDNLPSSSDTNNGHYYIVRSILQTAIEHFTKNKPTKSPVIFKAANPYGQGEWVEIKYYFNTNPVTPTQNMVTFAYARLIKTAIPASHAGLMQLATDDELTKPFTSTDNAPRETALYDGDWIISDGEKWLRLRQTRVSILANAVTFDPTFMYAINRVITEEQTNSVQAVIDSLLKNALRRTGDAMYDDGKKGKGRLALMYGTSTEPALTFNNNPYDPVLNPGIDPSKWSDSKTGLFHPTDGSISFTNNGIEKLRQSPTVLTIFESTNDPDTNPTLQFQHSTNTKNIGISAYDNILYLSINGKTQVKFKEQLTQFHGKIEVDDDALIKGNATINKNLLVKGNGDINQNFHVGGDSVLDKTLTVKGNIFGNSNITIDGDGLIKKELTVNGNINGKNNIIIDKDALIKGNLTVNGTSTHNGDMFAKGNLTVDKNIIGKGTLNISGDGTFNSNLNVDKNIIGKGTLNISGDGTFNSNLNVDKNIIGKGTLNISGDGTFNSNLNVDKNLMVNGNSTFKNPALFEKQVTLKDKLLFDNFEIYSKDNKLNFDADKEINTFIFNTKTDSVIISRFGMKIPFLNPVDNTKGTDGMIAYSTPDKDVMVKVDGVWRPVSYTNYIEQTFTKSSWGLSGGYYNITITNNKKKKVLSTEIYEGNVKVEVDSVTIDPTTNNISIKVPATPDLRFDGKAVIIIQN